MKETRLFYCPALPAAGHLPALADLPDDEAAHAVRVLRLDVGDSVALTNGAGIIAIGTVATATKHGCSVQVEKALTPPALWHGGIHIAVAPTKNQDRMEWFVEKATEIGADSITFLATRNGERSRLRTDRLQRNAVSAMKQSHKAWLPVIEGPVPFAEFLQRHAATPHKYICHCHEQEGLGEPLDTDGDALGLPLYCTTTAAKPLLLDIIPPKGDAVVMIGPEGDFTTDEVREAAGQGWKSVSLGESRLRTETAALAAVHMMYLRKRKG